MDKFTKYIKLFNLSTKFDDIELKKAYREKVILFHPDKKQNISEEEKKEFKEKTMLINIAYTYLKKYAIKKDIKKILSDKLREKFEKEEEDIFKLYDICQRCKGNKTIQSIKCEDKGYILVKCNKCNQGKFTLRNGKIVKCKACNGTTIFKLRCNHNISFLDYYFAISKGNSLIKKDIICPNCNGRGKVERILYNPVIKKGIILK